MPVETIYLFSQEDVVVLRNLIEKLKKWSKNKPLRSVEVEEGYSPDVYISKATDGSLSIMIGDVPGDGTSAIQKVPDPFDPEISQVVGFEKQVFNVTPRPVPEDAVFIMLRDKFGSWLSV